MALTPNQNGGSYTTGCLPGTYNNPVDLGTAGLGKVSAKATAKSGYYFVSWALNATSAYIQSQPWLYPHNPDPIDGTTWAGYYSHLNPTTIPLNATTYILTAYFQKQNQWVRSANNPVLVAGPTGSWDSLLVTRPKPFLYSDGTYGMIYAGGNSYSSVGIFASSVGLATSSDGVNWVKYANNPVLSPTDVAWVNGTVAPRIRPGSVFYDSSTELYVFYFTAPVNVKCGANPCNRWFVGRATSTDSMHWVTSPQPIILTPNGWGWVQVAVVNAGGYKMWAQTWDDGVGAFYYFTSTDGVSWAPGNGGNPVFSPTGSPTDWDGNETYAQDIVYDSTSHVYTMFYGGCDPSCYFYGTLGRIGYATSTDGISWTRYSGNPILAPMPSKTGGGWENGDSTDKAGALLLPNHVINLYYSADTFSNAQCVDQIWPGPSISEGGYGDMTCDHLQTNSIGLISVPVPPQFTGPTLDTGPAAVSALQPGAWSFHYTVTSGSIPVSQATVTGATAILTLTNVCVDTTCSGPITGNQTLNLAGTTVTVSILTLKAKIQFSWVLANMNPNTSHNLVITLQGNFTYAGIVNLNGSWTAKFTTTSGTTIITSSKIITVKVNWLS